MKLSRKNQQLTQVIFILYMLLIFWIIAMKCNMPIPISDSRYINRNTTLIERFVKYIPRPSFRTEWKDALVNIILFLPIGALLPFLVKKRNYITSGVICFAISAGFEILQIISCIGGFAYIDIIHNTVGGVIGIVLHRIFAKRLKENILSNVYYVIIGLISCTLIYAKVNTLINLELYL